MKKIILSSFFFIVLTFSVAVFPLSIKVSAHAGKTDWQGGHTDRETGDYHYHHGYQAHDHYDIDGDGKADCPYDFDDKTNHRSGSSTSSRSYFDFNFPELEIMSLPTIHKTTENKDIGTNTDIEKSGDEKVPEWIYWTIGILVVVVVFLLWYNKEQEKEINKLRDEFIKEKAKHDIAMKKQEKTYEDYCKSLTEEIIKREKEHEQTSKVLKQNINRELNRYDRMMRDKYGRNYLCVLFGAGEIDYVGSDYLPASDDGSCKKWGEKYTFYTSSVSNRNKYHSSNCRNCGITPINAYTIFSSGLKYTPCKFCKPDLPELDWYIKYRELIKFKSTYLN